MPKQNNVEDKLYEAQVNFCETEIGQENDPEEEYDERDEVFQSLPEELKDAMREYFFAGRNVDVDDVFEYRRQLLQEKPWIKEKATEGLRKFIENYFYNAEDWLALTDEQRYRQELREKGTIEE